MSKFPQTGLFPYSKPAGLETSLAGDEAVVNTAKWYQAWLAGQNMAEYTDCQIKEYFGI